MTNVIQGSNDSIMNLIRSLVSFRESAQRQDRSSVARIDCPFCCPVGAQERNPPLLSSLSSSAPPVPAISSGRNSLLSYSDPPSPSFFLSTIFDPGYKLRRQSQPSNCLGHPLRQRTETPSSERTERCSSLHS